MAYLYSYYNPQPMYPGAMDMTGQQYGFNNLASGNNNQFIVYDNQGQPIRFTTDNSVLSNQAQQDAWEAEQKKALETAQKEAEKAQFKTELLMTAATSTVTAGANMAFGGAKTAKATSAALTTATATAETTKTVTDLSNALCDTSTKISSLSTTTAETVKVAQALSDTSDSISKIGNAVEKANVLEKAGGTASTIAAISSSADAGTAMVQATYATKALKYAEKANAAAEVGNYAKAAKMLDKADDATKIVEGAAEASALTNCLSAAKAAKIGYVEVALDVVQGVMYGIQTGDWGEAAINTGCSIVGGIAGAKVGAMAGAAIGSIFPGVGTAICGVIGAVVGAVVGWLASDGLKKLCHWVEGLFNKKKEEKEKQTAEKLEKDTKKANEQQMGAVKLRLQLQQARQAEAAKSTNFGTLSYS